MIFFFKIIIVLQGGEAAMRICICDDEQPVHSSVQELLITNSSAQDNHQITNFFSGEALMNAYAQGKRYDLIFLDVEMCETNGIEVAKRIRQIDETVIIIFISSHRQYVFDTFPVGAFHYIVKPIKPEEFADVYQRSLRKYKDLHAEICLKWMYERYKIPVHKIIYLEGSQRHVIFHTNDARYEGVGKVADYLAELIPNGFVQVHHSYIVNMDCIQKIQKDKVVLKNGENIWVSVRKQKDVLKAFDDYLRHRKW